MHSYMQLKLADISYYFLSISMAQTGIFQRREHKGEEFLHGLSDLHFSHGTYEGPTMAFK